MTDSKALIERLREVGRDGVWKSGRNRATAHPMCIEAADHIEKLEAELDRCRKSNAVMDNTVRELEADKALLREALEGVLTGSTDIECGERVIYAGAVNAVRAALQETSHDD